MVESNQRRLAEKIEDVDPPQEGAGRPARRRAADAAPAQRRSAREEARNQLLERLDKELSHEQGALITKHRKAMEASCDAKAKEMLITSIQRFAAAHTAEATTSTVDIPNDEMKGRIIGREGRNIRAFEKATGVDVIIDDTPGVVIVSAFDPVRREVGPPRAGQADRRWPHPPQPDRGARRRDRAGDRRQDPAVRRGGRAGGRRPRPARQGDPPARAGSSTAPATARTCCGTRSRWRSSPA